MRWRTVDTSPQSCDFLQLVTKMVRVLGASDAIFIKGSEVLNLLLGVENVLSWVVRDCLGPLCLPGLSAPYSGIADFSWAQKTLRLHSYKTLHLNKGEIKLWTVGEVGSFGFMWNLTPSKPEGNVPEKLFHDVVQLPCGRIGLWL